MPWERDVTVAERARCRMGGPTPRFGRAGDREGPGLTPEPEIRPWGFTGQGLASVGAA